ncbi:MAG: lipid-A-disaccharide synthase [Pseudomonadota bacterium]
MRAVMLAGEPSGDALGAALIGGLRAEVGEGLEVSGVGGPEMARAGLESLFPMDRLTVMGIAEVLPRLPELLSRIRETGDWVAETKPDVLITIDSPDFCLRVARRARRLWPELRTVHYVAPSVWAWRPGRAVKMARMIEHVLALLPFEPKLMEAAGMSSDFVGHPITSLAPPDRTRIRAFRSKAGLRADEPVLIVLPGSRRGEVRRVGPVFRDTVRILHRQFRDIRPVIPMVAARASEVRDVFADTPGRPIFLDPAEFDLEEKLAAFATADLALAASGTVTLELAAAGAPMIVAYNTNWLTGMIARRMVRLETVTLVNLITGRLAVPEFLLERCRPGLIAAEAKRYLLDTDLADAQRAVSQEAMRRLGRDGPDPGLLAARSVLAHLSRPQVRASIEARPST